MRLLLEGDALTSAMEHGRDDWESRVVAAFHGLALIEQRLDTTGPLALSDSWSMRHKAFHLSLFSGCNSPLLLRTAEVFFVQADRFRASPRCIANWRATRYRNTSTDGHHAGPQEEGGCRALREHIMKTTDNVAAALDAWTCGPGRTNGLTRPP